MGQNGTSTATYDSSAESLPSWSVPLPGEKIVWFKRFCLYRDLGHKRSLRTAVAKERETIRLATMSHDEKTLSSVKPVNVPGAWKDASKAFLWQERAQRFDAWLLNNMVTVNHERLGETYANKFKRVKILDSMINTSLSALNDAKKQGMSHEHFLNYMKRIAALLQQMEQETSQFTEAEMKASIAAYASTMRENIENAFFVGDRQTVIVT